jgi:hypothetical protein
MNWEYYKVAEVLWRLSIILARWNVSERGSSINRDLFDRVVVMVKEGVDDEMGRRRLLNTSRAVHAVCLLSVAQCTGNWGSMACTKCRGDKQQTLFLLYLVGETSGKK